MSHKPGRRYVSYLLRLWQTDDNGRPVWRALLEQAGSGERRGFAGVSDLCNFLLAQTQDDAEPPLASDSSTSVPQSKNE